VTDCERSARVLNTASEVLSASSRSSDRSSVVSGAFTSPSRRGHTPGQRHFSGPWARWWPTCSHHRRFDALIRPWLRANKYRVTRITWFSFIFIVSNAGGCLTPWVIRPVPGLFERRTVLVGGANTGWRSADRPRAILLAMFLRDDAPQLRPARPNRCARNKRPSNGGLTGCPTCFISLWCSARCCQSPAVLREA